MLGVIKYVGESSSALLAFEDFAVSSGDAVVPTVPVGTLARASSFEQPLKIEVIIKIITNRITKCAHNDNNSVSGSSFVSSFYRSSGGTL